MGLNTDAHHRELIFSNLLLILIYIACIYFKLPFSATARWDENECGMLKQTTVRCFFGGTPPCAYKRIFVSVKLPGPTLVDFVRSCCVITLIVHLWCLSDWIFQLISPLIVTTGCRCKSWGLWQRFHRCSVFLLRPLSVAYWPWYPKSKSM